MLPVPEDQQQNRKQTVLNVEHHEEQEHAKTVPVHARDETFIDAWKHSTETCKRWISIQQHSKSYIDAYVVGSQKGATSELSKNLFNLGVRQSEMVKEWHFFNRLNMHGDLVTTRTVGQPLPPLNDIHSLKLMHYTTGFPHSNITAYSEIPTVDGSSIKSRKLTLDMTVEYLHSDRSAILASTLTPNAKIIITIRNPLERALSQYNMNIRNGNKIRRKLGLIDRISTPEEFDYKIRYEIRKLKSCGYDPQTARLNYGMKTSQLIGCMFNNSRRNHFDDALYVTRGLYHLHIGTWRDHFPDHHILIISFQDVSLGSRNLYQSLTEFLCVKPYPKEWLQAFEKQGSKLSFGQIAVVKGLETGGFDSYHGNDRYLSNMLPETDYTLKQFFAPADKRLKAMLGTHHVYWSEETN